MAGVCGKDCRDCDYRQRYGCRGCLETGGNPVWGSCRAAACCYSQGMQNCGACPTREGCGRPADMESARQRWEREEEDRRGRWRANLARRTPVMAQWLPVLFWLSLVSTVLNLMDELPLSQGTSLAVSVTDLCLGIGMLAVYWKLAPLSDRLRLVWRLQLAAQIVAVAAVVAMLPALFSPDLAPGLGTLGLIGALAVAVVGLVAMYQFCEAMAEELEQSDPPGVGQTPPPAFRGGEGRRLADSWRLLRKCAFWSLGVMLGVLLLALLVQGGMGILLLLVVLAAALVLAGCSIAQMVMLWKSASFFRELPPADPTLPPVEE